MPSFQVAAFNEQGENVIVIFVGESLGHASQAEQNAVRNELQMRARAAGLPGTVVLVWGEGFGGMGFLAPRNWHAFFESIGYDELAANINHELSW